MYYILEKKNNLKTFFPDFGFFPDCILVLVTFFQRKIGNRKIFAKSCSCYFLKKRLDFFLKKVDNSFFENFVNKNALKTVFFAGFCFSRFLKHFLLFFFFLALI